MINDVINKRKEEYKTYLILLFKLYFNFNKC